MVTNQTNIRTVSKMNLGNHLRQVECVLAFLSTCMCVYHLELYCHSTELM